MEFNNKIEEMSCKMTVISNINMMRNVMGLNDLNFKHQMKKSYDELSNEQNSVIEHYNQANRNKRELLNK